MPEKFRCPDRQRMSERVVRATQEVYRMRTDQRSATDKSEELRAARVELLAAEREA